MKKTCLLFPLIIFCFIHNLRSQSLITPELLWKLGRISEVVLSPDGKTLLFGITYYDLKTNKGNRDLYTLGINGGMPVKVTDFNGSEYNGVWRPDGKKIAFLSNESGSSQIWEMNIDGSSKKQISNIDNGINGFKYSPDLKYMLYISDIKLDKTPNEVYPDLPMANAKIIDDLMYRHWNSWHDYSYSHIFIAPYQDGIIGQGMDIMENEKFDSPLYPFGGMEQINWSHDGSLVAYTCKKLSGKNFAVSTNSDIYIYNLADKKTENISEKLEGYDMDPVFSPDHSKIVWSCMKTPAFESDKKSIILFDLTSKEYTDLSAGFDQSASNFQWNTRDKNILYFISGTNATYQVYSINILTKKITQLTDGWHNYTEICTSGNILAGTKMSMSMPTEIFKFDNNKPKAKEIQLTYINKSLLNSISMAKVEQRWIKTTDNKKMLVWIIFPPNFDPTLQYPALLYCQGGPQSAVSQFFSYRWNFQLMAAKGYIIIAPNRRGLPTFGQEWNNQISKDYGGQNMIDLLTAIDTVSSEPYIDKNRLGAVGASYGGFSVYWLAGHHNKRFKAFIAHCGMFNFESWYGSTEEYWFANYDLGGAYWQSPVPKSYEFSPHKFVGNWDTPILVIEGANDFRIPYTEGIQAYNAAQLQGIPSRFLYFPEETHFVLKPQNSVLWQRVFFEWLDKYLK